jgi:hypothetical protein
MRFDASDIGVDRFESVGETFRNQVLQRPIYEGRQRMISSLAHKQTADQGPQWASKKVPA